MLLLLLNSAIGLYFDVTENTALELFSVCFRLYQLILLKRVKGIFSCCLVVRANVVNRIGLREVT